MASALATGDTRQVRRITRMGLWLSVFYAALAIPLHAVRRDPCCWPLGPKKKKKKKEPEVAPARRALSVR